MFSVLRLALREVRNDPRFAAFFVFNLALGLAAFVALDAFDSSVSRELRGRSKALLGADLAVSSRRPLTTEETQRFDAIAGSDAPVSQLVELFSMVRGPRGTRLAAIHAVDVEYPLYGAIVLSAAGVAGEAEQGALVESRGAWIDPPLLSQLGVEVGDEIAIGATSFRVVDSVERDAGRPTSGFSIAPRIYLSRAHLEATELVATGSRIEYRRLYRLAEGSDATAVAEAMRRATGDERISTRSHEEATLELARAYGAVGRYLGLVSLSAVFLAGVGAAYLFRAFLSRRLGEIAILLSLGATRRRAQGVFVAQLLLLAAAAAVAACGLAAALLPTVGAISGAFLPEAFAPRMSARMVALALAAALLCSGAACLPLLVHIRRLRPSQLFAERARPSLGRGTRDVLLWLPALALLWGAAVWRADDLQTGSLFAGLFAAALALLVVLAAFTLRGLGSLSTGRALPLRLALRELANNRSTHASSFAAIGLCALLLTIAPQLRGAIAQDLGPPEGTERPSLFLFDIQPEQLAPLEAHVAERSSRLQRLSPLVRARLDAIDGESVSRSARRMRRRGHDRRYNLSYAAAFSEFEAIRTGRPFNGAYASDSSEPAELSLEIEFARRLGVGLGTQLRFDVQGVPVEGRVVSLREIHWASFQPNFFVTFQPGVLEDAPKTFLASVPPLPPEKRQALQQSIVEAFPNISVVDVTRAVTRLLSLLSQLQWALTSTAAFSLFTGFVLVYAIARDRARAHRWETNLLKVLGAEFREIRFAIDLEFGLLASLATASGCFAGALASALLARAVLDLSWAPSWPPLLLTLGLVPAICLLAARIATRSVLRERPLALLQAAEA